MFGVGRRPISQACIFALGSSGAVGQAITATDGRWTISGLPVNLPLAVGVIPPFDIGLGPCRSNGVPPAPAAGQLQPEFYLNTWVNLADPGLEEDPYGVAIARGAQSITNSRSAIDVCLTTDAGTVVPRPSCDPTPSPTASPEPTQTTTVAPASNADAQSGADPNLANTGGVSGWLLALAIGLLSLGAVVLRRSTDRR